ncbi:MAG: beta-propeller repeat protein [Chitinophagaceae bacterium]|nr:beta-propeller repeat protein [Chitinophagaceae bacterium]
MRKFILPAVLFFAFTANAQQAKEVLLPNGWRLSPAGKQIQLGDLPLNMTVSPNGRWIAVTNNGQSTQSIELIDVTKERLADSVTIAKSWYGLQFTQDGKFLLASAGNDNQVLVYNTNNNKLNRIDSFVLGKKWPEKISPAGLAIDDVNKMLYVVTKENNSLYVFNLLTKKIENQYKLDGEGYACILSADRKNLYISCWGCDRVIVFNTKTKSVQTTIGVGDNPNELLLTKNGRWLFVCNGNDNSVSIIDTRSNTVIETLNAALYPGAPSGSTTNGAALSNDERTLIVANADNNCLAVFDVSVPGKSVAKGFIPTGWYPTNVKVINNKIYVTNGKGLTSLPNPYGPKPVAANEQVVYQQGDVNRPKQVQYIAGLFKGTLSIINMPDEKMLAAYSKQVYQNTPYTKEKELLSDGETGNPVPMKVGDKSPIKHVFYIIKENRTYDQVLGDIKEGNGDPGLVLFGENVTPNLHALAKQFVLLDNFYVNAEVSSDGHNWSMGGYATDYLEKTWPTSYGGRGGNYDGEGNRAIANNKGGFIWENCQRNNVGFRSYGEFADNAKPNIPILKNHVCPYYTGWDMATKDTTRFQQWKKEFDSLVSKNAVPQLSTLRFGNDHTEGLRKGRPTPYAHVADNDLAVGLFIEHLSKSPIWNESVVFILEDDAQNGSDHVDAHRSTTYVAGGFVKRGFVDHTLYTTTSVLRTIELILGMPPMTQYDAAATSMWRCFNKQANSTGYTSLPARINLNDKNTGSNALQRAFEKMDFASEDAVPDLEFNKLLWKALKPDQPYPSPKRAAFVKVSKKDDD